MLTCGYTTTLSYPWPRVVNGRLELYASGAVHRLYVRTGTNPDTWAECVLFQNPACHRERRPTFSLAIYAGDGSVLRWSSSRRYCSPVRAERALSLWLYRLYGVTELVWSASLPALASPMAELALVAF